MDTRVERLKGLGMFESGTESDELEKSLVSDGIEMSVQHGVASGSDGRQERKRIWSI